MGWGYAIGSGTGLGELGTLHLYIKSFTPLTFLNLIFSVFYLQPGANFKKDAFLPFFDLLGTFNFSQFYVPFSILGL